MYGKIWYGVRYGQACAQTVRRYDTMSMVRTIFLHKTAYFRILATIFYRLDGWIRYGVRYGAKLALPVQKWYRGKIGLIFKCISLQTCTTSSSSTKANQKPPVPNLSVPSVFQYPVDSKFSLQNMLLTLQDSVAWTIYTMFLRARFATDATASTSRQADKKAQLYEVSTLALCSCWCISVAQPSLLCIGMCGWTKFSI